MENNFIQIAASAGHAVAYKIGPIFKHIIDCVQLAVFQQWVHEYCPLKRQLSLACRHTYLWRHPTNNSQTVSNHCSDVSFAADASSNTGRKISWLALAVWHAAPSCWN